MITLSELIKVIVPLETVRSSKAVLRQTVTAVTSDSRTLIPGSLFVAIRGAKADGRAYIAEAISRGCLAVVIDGGEGYRDLDVPTILVRDSHEALGELAAAWHGYPAKQLHLIGITGTNGKTTCSWLIEEMLVAAGYRPGVIGTVNYRYYGELGPYVIQDAPLTTPDPVTLQRLLKTMAEHRVTHVIIEVSSHALQQNRLGRTLFDVAVFTNLSRDHLDYHPTMEQYFDTKKLLFQRHLKQNGVAVVVAGTSRQGTDWGALLASTLPRPLIRCGLSGDCEVTAHALKQTLEGFGCSLEIRGEQVAFSSSLTGGYNVLNVLAAAGVGLGLGLPTAQICEGLARVKTVPGRLERVLLPGASKPSGPMVFVDYAHTPDALENVLKTLKALSDRRLVCVFGCGGDRDRGKRPLMGAIAGQYADVVIVTADNPRSENPDSILRSIVNGVESSGKGLCTVPALFGEKAVGGYAVIDDRRRAIAQVCSLAGAGDCVLVAGKGHEHDQIIGKERHFFDDRLEVLNGLLRWNEHHLLAATSGRVAAGSQRGIFHDISTDSRRLKQGDIFIALNGETFDGHAYIEAAVDSGAAAIIAERMPQKLQEQVLFIQVADSLQALGQLAAYRRRLLAPGVKIAAITGSSGKTTVKELTAGIFTQALLAARTGIDPVLKTKGNFNNLIGLPLSLLPLEAGHRLAILEMGMNAPGEIARLTAIADPDIGCINNVHPAHLLGLGSIEGVARAKGELFARMRPDAVRVVNCDDPHVLALARQAGGRQVGFAVTAAGRKQKPQVWVTRLNNLGEGGMRFTLHIGPWRARITVPVHGSHNVANCAAATAIAHAAGIEPAAIVEGLQGYTAMDKRLAVSEMPGGLRVVNDAYNANPASMAAGLRTVAAFGRGGRHVAALGDMLELGAASEALHRDIGTLVAALGYNRLALTGPHARIVAGAALAAGMEPTDVRIFEEPQAIADWLCLMLAEGQLDPGDWLLVKGSRGMRMERLIEAMEQRLRTAN